MPELPEVDSYRTGLDKMIKGWKLKGGRSIWQKACIDDFSIVKDQKIKGFDRRGKYLIINLSRNHIIIHLRMTGRIDVGFVTPKYTTVEFDFENGQKMCLVDYRKFGRVWIVDNPNTIVNHLGIEPLSSKFTLKKFNELIEKRSGTIKPLLLNQAFIAAVLTVIGYSLNDTVVVFDRIREYRNINTSWEITRVVNTALNSTLSRTLNTSFTTLLVLLTIFIFGGESIRGFMFALIIGVIIGTYSSVFVATPIMFDTLKKSR